MNSLFCFLLVFITTLLEAQAPFRSNQSTASPQPKLSLRQWSMQVAARAVKPTIIVQKGFVLLDPGHGGQDVGTQSISKPRYQEKSLNLVTAKFAKDYLQQLGYRVEMTRQEDKFISLEKRAEMANEKQPDVFVSIHYNSAPSAQAQGIEVFFYQSKENKKRAAESKHLAQVILKSVLAETDAKSRGIKHGDYAVIRETDMPAILIEGGFVTNEEELERLKNPNYLKKLAWGIAKGVDEYWDN